jgi:hypothetical protein
VLIVIGSAGLKHLLVAGYYQRVCVCTPLHTARHAVSARLLPRDHGNTRGQLGAYRLAETYTSLDRWWGVGVVEIAASKNCHKSFPLPIYSYSLDNTVAARCNVLYRDEAIRTTAKFHTNCRYPVKSSIAVQSSRRCQSTADVIQA